jgi:hypothetical protein
MELVIFDTNAYRNIAADRDFQDLENDIIKFKSIELEQGITSLMHPIVIKELLYHVVGERDNMHDKCISALKAMYHHCSNGESFRLLADFDLQLGKVFFDTVDPNRERVDKQLGEIVSALATKPIENVLKLYQFNLKQIREYVQSNESFFKGQLKTFIKAIDPDAESWTVFQDDDKMRKKALDYFESKSIEDEIALSYILMTHHNLLEKGLIKKPDSKEELKRKANHFQAPIILYKNVLKKFNQPDFNMDKKSRENFVWDIHLMFIVSSHQIKGAPMYLITSDKEMRNAAIQCGFNGKVLSFDEYIEFITGRKENFDQNEDN